MTNNTTVHLASDLHLEFYSKLEDKLLPKVSGDIMVLAGDITTLGENSIKLFREYVGKLHASFNDLVLVLGNHEFYRYNFFDALKLYDELCDELGIHLLDVSAARSSISLNGKTISGSTLWTNLKNGDPMVEIEATKKINDFNLIGGFDVNIVKQQNAKAIEAIDFEADLVITHHAPILTSKATKFPVDLLSYNFYNDNPNLEAKMAASNNIKYWIHGHTHHNWQSERLFESNELAIITNQAGYPHEFDYDDELLIMV